VIHELIALGTVQLRGGPREEMPGCPPIKHTSFFIKNGGFFLEMGRTPASASCDAHGHLLQKI
jgi:hypothetical protein